jgi:hypothetical protein
MTMSNMEFSWSRGLARIFRREGSCGLRRLNPATVPGPVRSGLISHSLPRRLQAKAESERENRTTTSLVVGAEVPFRAYVFEANGAAML